MFKKPQFERKLHEDGRYWYHFEEDWDRKRVMYGNSIMTATLVVLIVSMIFLGVSLTRNVTEVRANPLTYGAELLGGDTRCSCMKINSQGEVVMFEFDEERMWVTQQSQSLI